MTLEDPRCLIISMKSSTCSQVTRHLLLLPIQLPTVTISYIIRYCKVYLCNHHSTAALCIVNPHHISSSMEFFPFISPTVQGRVVCRFGIRSGLVLNLLGPKQEACG